MGEHIWVVRDACGTLVGAGSTYYSATGEAYGNVLMHLYDKGKLERAAENGATTVTHNGYTLTREPLPTGTAGVGEPVRDSYKLPRVVEALIAAAEAYEKKFGHFQDYRLSMRDDAFPTDKVERAVVVAVRQYRAALAASTRTGDA